MTRQELIDFIRGNIYPNGQNQITAPMVRDAVLAVVAFLGDAAVKDVGTVIEFNDGLVTGGDVYNAIRSYLSTVLNLVGETTTDIVADPTANPVYVDGEPHTAKKGDVVIYGAKEFWWNGTEWKELGDEASWALKTITITGTGDITGGGTLEANRTLDLTQEAKDKLAHGETAFSWFESYLENRLRLKTPYDYLNVRKGLILEPDDYATTPADLFKQVVTIDGVETTILRSKLPIVSDSFMSAGGLSANGGGGGGGISLDAMWNSLTNSVPDAYASTPINIAHIPNITVSKVSDIESWINGKGYMTNADLSNYLPLTGGTMANTNLVTNMNADLLDGVHNGLLTAQYFGYGEIIDENNDLNSITPGIYTYQNNHNPSHSLSTNTILLSFANRSRKDTFQILYAANSGTALFFRQTVLADNPQYTNWSDWKTFAFTDGNVATATALQNTRYIWGQPFSGVADVSGAMSSVASIDSLLYFDTTNTRVGIGIDAPADTLDVNGSIHATSLRIGAGSPVLVWDAVNSAWHLNGNFYADGFISAGGFSDTSGGGGIDLGAMWGSLTNSVPDEYANTPIALAHIPDITTAKVSNIESWIDGKGYLTSSAAASTYLTIATASSTYQPIISDLSTIRSNAANGNTAYGWGNHATAGYAMASSLANYLPLTGGTMANTNLVTNMNADLLDGHHDGELTTRYISGRWLTNVDSLNDISSGFFYYTNTDNPTSAVGNNSAGYQLSSRFWDRFQIVFAGNNEQYIAYRNSYYTSDTTYAWTAWKTIAFTSSNVASATALATSRFIWGQSFNGTADVSGALSGATTIDASSWIRTANQLISTVSTGTAPLAVSSTTTVTNLNADLFDSVHLLTTVSDWNSTSTTPSIFKVGLNTAPNGPVANWAYGITLRHSGEANLYFSDIVTPLYSTALYYRRHDTEGFSAWKQIAFTDGNVATATALQTSRSIWGQSFNGTTDVSGALSGASTGEFSSWVKASYYYVGGYSAYLEYANSAIHANVGFYSNNYISAGGLSTSSDARLKMGVQTIDSERAWKVIMGLRPTEFRWIENGEESAGFIAQEVEQIVPFAVKEIGEVKRLNYDNIFTYGIQAIRDMKFWRESTEQRIKRLEKKIDELKTELNKLRS